MENYFEWDLLTASLAMSIDMRKEQEPEVEQLAWEFLVAQELVRPEGREGFARAVLAGGQVWVPDDPGPTVYLLISSACHREGIVLPRAREIDPEGQGSQLRFKQFQAGEPMEPLPQPTRPAPSTSTWLRNLAMKAERETVPGDLYLGPDGVGFIAFTPPRRGRGFLVRVLVNLALVGVIVTGGVLGDENVLMAGIVAIVLWIIVGAAIGAVRASRRVKTWRQELDEKPLAELVAANPGSRGTSLDELVELEAKARSIGRSEYCDIIIRRTDGTEITCVTGGPHQPNFAPLASRLNALYAPG